MMVRMEGNMFHRKWEIVKGLPSKHTRSIFVKAIHHYEFEGLECLLLEAFNAWTQDVCVLETNDRVVITSGY